MRAQPDERSASQLPIRRLGYAAVSFCCLGISIFLLYSMTLLHFAAGSWAFFQIPAADPRPAGYWNEFAMLFCQIAGGVSLALCWMSRDGLRRVLKWSPLFIAGFAIITWIVALALTPLRVIR